MLTLPTVIAGVLLATATLPSFTDAACCCEVAENGEYQVDWCRSGERGNVYYVTGMPFPDQCQEFMNLAIENDYLNTGVAVR